MNTIKLMGVDPGTNFTGVTIIEVTVPDLKIVNITPHLIDVSGFESVYHTDLQFRLEQIFYRFMSLLRYYEPFLVSIEHGFINRFRPAAYGPLSQIRAVLEQSVLFINNDPYMDGHMRINGFAPSTIKNAVGSKGGADKVTIQTAVSNINELSNFVDVNLLSEHEVDGIAIAYTQLQVLRENSHLLLI